MTVDLGCGWLKYPATVKKPHLKLKGVVGVDLCRYGNDVVADALRSPFRAEVADMVVARQFIEHLDAQGLVREAWRILKPNGELLLNTPNALWVFKVLRALRGLEANPYPEHIQIFTAAELRNLLGRNGFVNVEVSYYNCDIGNPNPFLSFLKKMLVFVQTRIFPMFNRGIVVTARKNGSAKFEGYR